MAGSGPDRSLAALGLAAFACYAIHATFEVVTGHAANLLWNCNIAALAVVAGSILRSPRLCGTGTVLLSVGIFMWLIDVASGGGFDPTSLFVHVGVLAIGLTVSRRLGLPRGTWFAATSTVLALNILCRFVTPPAENVNLAFAVHPSAARFVHSHTAYIAVLTVIVGAIYFAAERLLRRLFRVEPLHE